MEFLESYIFFLRKHYRAALAAMAVATLFFCYLLSGVKFANAFEGWVQKDHPAIKDYRKFLRCFHSFEIVAVAMETENGVFELDALRRMGEVDRKIRERAPSVRSTTIFNTAVLRETKRGLKFGRSAGGVPGTREEAEKLRRIIYDNPLVAENFISRDGKNAMIILVFVGGGPDYSYIARDLAEIRKVMAEETAPGVKFHLAGGLVLNREMNRLTRRQGLAFAPIVFGLATLLLIVLLRRARDVVLVQLCTACSMVWGMGLYVGAGNAVNFLTIALPPLILVISVSDSVHIIMRYREELGAGRQPRDAVAEAVRGTFRPCLFTSLTTAVGFGSLSAGGIPVIRDFGLFAAAGIVMTFVVSMVIVPAALFALAGRETADTGPGESTSFSPILAVAVKVALRKPAAVLAVGIAMFAVSIHGITQINTDTNNLEFFKKNNPVRKDMEFVEKNLVGLSAMEIMFEAKTAARMDEPETLRAMHELEKFLQQQPQVTNTLSLADFIVEINRRLTGRENEFPESATLVRLMMGDSRFDKMKEKKQFIQPTGARARISARVKYSSTKDLRALVNAVRGYLREHESPNYSVTTTGGALLYLHIADSVLAGQVKSFLLVIAVVSVMMIVLFRSFAWGALGMIPSLIPILFVMGIMGWTGIPLNLATMMIAGISIGIAVDDTMHYMARVRREIARGLSHEDAVRRTLLTTGRPMITTTLVLMAGFGALVFSSFVPIMQFALLSTLTMIFALLGDLFMFSALLVILKPKV